MRMRILFAMTLLLVPVVAMAQERTNPKEDAEDTMYSNTAIEFVNTLTFGFTYDLIRENSFSFSNDHLYWKGIAISPLNEAEQKGVSAGQLLGKAAAVTVWGIILFALWFRRARRKLTSHQRQRLAWIIVIMILFFFWFMNYWCYQILNS